MQQPPVPGGVPHDVPHNVPRDVPALLRSLLAQDPGRPRVTWYGPDGERVELSAKVLDNWVAKTSNLLVEELDAGPGTTVAVELPPHWRTAVWLLATWSVGACVVAGPPSAVHGDADVVVGTDPAGARSPGGRVVAVALPALATRWPGTLPPDVLDAALEVRTYGDVFVPLVTPSPGDPALRVAADAPDADDVPVLPHGGLLPAAVDAAARDGLGEGVRLLTGAGPRDAVRGLLAPLVLGGSVVLHHDLAALDEPDLAALMTAEMVTAVTREPRMAPPSLGD